MAIPPETKEPLQTAIKAVVFKAVSEHGHKTAADQLGIGVRTLQKWLRHWGVPKHQRPRPLRSEQLRELIEYLGLQPNLVVIPPELRTSIEQATEALLTGNTTRALNTLLEINLKDRRHVPPLTATEVKRCQ
jgi:transposase-like protein